MSFAIPICALAAACFNYVGVRASYMVDYLGIPKSTFGRYQGPIVGCFSIVSLSASKLLQRFGLMSCIKAGVFFMSVGCLLLLSMSIFRLDHALCTTLFMMLFAGGMAPVCSLLFPYSVAHLPSELQGCSQALIQALRLFFTSVGTFTLAFVYKGPLLPVALILFVVLVGSVFMLWCARAFMKEQVDSGMMVSGH